MAVRIRTLVESIRKNSWMRMSGVERICTGLLWGVTPTDPLTYVVMIIVMLRRRTGERPAV
jgi:hypothetical protein